MGRNSLSACRIPSMGRASRERQPSIGQRAGLSDRLVRLSVRIAKVSTFRAIRPGKTEHGDEKKRKKNCSFADYLLLLTVSCFTLDAAN